MDKQNYFYTYICIFVPLAILLGFVLFKMNKIQQAEEKMVMSHEIQKAQRHLMLDLMTAPLNSLALPANGQWYDHIKAGTGSQSFAYVIKDNQLWRITPEQTQDVANYMQDLRVRRQSASSDIIEVQLQAQDGIPMFSYLKLRMHR